MEGPTGIEPAFLAWEANVLPLDDGPEGGLSLNCLTLAEAAAPILSWSRLLCRCRGLAHGPLCKRCALILGGPLNARTRDRRKLHRQRLRKPCAGT